jgi:hypothetical protein
MPHVPEDGYNYAMAIEGSVPLKIDGNPGRDLARPGHRAPGA